ncbi:unnamed protein product [Rotaria sp. Silwood2]|nr:unnamed protein product [Rotaria sp. Silwood2]
MLVFEFPACFFSILIFAHLALNHEARSQFKNHGWLVLITTNFMQLLIDLPMPMSYYYMEIVWPASDAYCVWWTWFEFSINTIGLFLMAWISIERHVLVFQPRAIQHKTWKKWIFHFVPIILCLIWTPIFYFVAVVICPHCTNVWDFNLVNCGVPCYFTANFLGQFDIIFNIAAPITIIILANLTLIIRVTYQKTSRNRAINWRRHRKMVLQLWTISSLYMAFWLPLAITQLTQITVMPSFMINELETILFVVYLIPLFLPMVCLSTLPNLVKKIVNTIAKPNLNVIGTITFNRGIGQIAINTIDQ